MVDVQINSMYLIQVIDNKWYQDYVDDDGILNDGWQKQKVICNKQMFL